MPRRFMRWSRKLHRWIAYGLGAIVAMWVVTGVFMMFPPQPLPLAPAPPIDPSLAVRSPSEAAQALPAQERVRSVTLRSLGGKVVFQFALQNGSHMLVDAATAQRVDFTDTLARAIARASLRGREMPDEMSRIERHDAMYRAGPLPAYRLQLAPVGTLHVGADGSVTSTNSRSRLRVVMGGLHEFRLPVYRVPERVRRLSLLVASVVTVVLVVTGYVLVFPLRKRVESEVA